MREVCTDGPGHYLGHNQTIALMQSEYVYPVLGDRSSPKEWNERGKPDIVEKAIRRKHAILDAPPPAHIPAAIDAAIRQRFEILLPREVMGG